MFKVCDKESRKTSIEVIMASFNLTLNKFNKVIPGFTVKFEYLPTKNAYHSSLKMSKIDHKVEFSKN